VKKIIIHMADRSGIAYQCSDFAVVNGMLALSDATEIAAWYSNGQPVPPGGSPQRYQPRSLMIWPGPGTTVEIEDLP
jgi:hypothetical protein